MLGRSVERLTADCAEHHSEFAGQGSARAILDTHYLSARYSYALPGSIPARVFDRGTAERAVGIAREVVEFVAERVARRDG